MPMQLKVSGDPRRPGEVHIYKRRKAEEAPPDMFLLLALALGLGAVMLKVKLLGWASVLACIVAIANASMGSADYKQMVSSIVFATFGLVSAYLQPQNKLTGGRPVETIPSAATEMPLQ